MISLVRRWRFDDDAILEYQNGDVYEGSMVRCLVRWNVHKPHGRGKMVCASGRVYEGEWKDCKFHGVGTCRYENGTIYEGTWKNGKQHGAGTMIRGLNGDSYEGEWEGGKRCGRGTLKGVDGRIRYEGEWKDNRMHGMGTYRYPNGNVYKGQWKNGKRQGRGTLTYANGDVRHAQWNGNKFRGKKLIKPVHRPKKMPLASAPLGGRLHRMADSQSDETNIVFELKNDHATCGICFERFSSDVESGEDRIKRRLPVLSTCGHWYCHGCVLAEQAARARRATNGRVPERIDCMCCREEGAFRPSKPTYHRLLIELLKQSS